MGIQAKEKEIELVVTWICNWHCEYCCVDTHNRPKLTMDQVKAKLDKIIPGYNVTLSGGEVGSMKRADIEYILNDLESKGCRVSINTNGLFIKRYRDLLPKFEEILYHCSEDLDIDDEIIIDPELNLNYMLVVTDNNFKNLEKFLEKYKDIKFNLVPATNPRGMFGPILSPINKNKMIKLYHHRMTKDSILRNFKEKDFDSIIYL
jgi:organic radical activating enzyme